MIRASPTVRCIVAVASGGGALEVADASLSLISTQAVTELPCQAVPQTKIRGSSTSDLFSSPSSVEKEEASGHSKGLVLSHFIIWLLGVVLEPKKKWEDISRNHLHHGS